MAFSRFKSCWGSLSALALLTLVGCASPKATPVATPVTEPSSHREPAHSIAPVVEPAPEAVTPAPAARGAYHQVERGQTLFRIARTYGVTLEVITQANRLSDPSKIEVGDRLWIPGAAQSLSVAATVPSATPDGNIDSLFVWTWPIADGQSEILSQYGVPRGQRTHRGLDIRGRQGQPVLAARSGVVTYSDSGMRGYGKTVIVDHGHGWSTLYAHNSKLLVARGERVEAGQPVARVGRSGNATTDHVHFEIRRGTQTVDPQRYLVRTSEDRR